MKKSIFVFLLYFILPCNLLFLNKVAEAVQIGDRIEIPVITEVYPDDGSNCKNYFPFKDLSCTMGLGDEVEILDEINNGPFVLKYFPGNKRWEGKCPSINPPGQNFCFINSRELEAFQAYSALEPRIEAVTESEEPQLFSPRKILGDKNSTAVVKGQIFSVFNHDFYFPPYRLHDSNSLSSWEFIFDAVRRPFDFHCTVSYGYKLKVVGFDDDYPSIAYVRLMRPEYEKKVVAYNRYHNCPVNSLFQIYIYDLIKGEALYRESLKLREDFLKILIFRAKNKPFERVFMVEEVKDNLFELPLTVDGLTVGQNHAFFMNQSGMPAIQNIDFEYLLGQERNDLGLFEDLLRKRPEDIKSSVEDLNPLFFITIPMINYFCEPTRSFGMIIGFIEMDPGLGYGEYTGSSEWFAVAEHRISGTDFFGNPDWRSLSCKFSLIPTRLLGK